MHKKHLQVNTEINATHTHTHLHLINATEADWAHAAL